MSTNTKTRRAIGFGTYRDWPLFWQADHATIQLQARPGSAISVKAYQKLEDMLAESAFYTAHQERYVVDDFVPPVIFLPLDWPVGETARSAQVPNSAQLLSEYNEPEGARIREIFEQKGWSQAIGDIAYVPTEKPLLVLLDMRYASVLGIT